MSKSIYFILTITLFCSCNRRNIEGLYANTTYGYSTLLNLSTNNRFFYDHREGAHKEISKGDYTFRRGSVFLSSDSDVLTSNGSVTEKWKKEQVGSVIWFDSSCARPANMLQLTINDTLIMEATADQTINVLIPIKTVHIKFSYIFEFYYKVKSASTNYLEICLGARDGITRYLKSRKYKLKGKRLIGQRNETLKKGINTGNIFN